jgi:hypothetical protein
MPAFSLNIAVDALLKKEFDIHRAAGTAHPYMTAAGIDAVPFRHERMDEWRDSLRRGVQFVFEPANLLVRGGIDDVWVAPDGELIIVDYKATATSSPISLNGPYKEGYKRQMEVYQWLFRKNGFRVSPRGYFLYCNGLLSAERFDGKLSFDVLMLPYEGDGGWIESTLMAMRTCLEQELPPVAGENCEHCPYRDAARRFDV